MIDLHGDLAGILSMATKTDTAPTGSDFALEMSQKTEKPPEGAFVVSPKLVAGVGFEPTTFRL